MVVARAFSAALGLLLSTFSSQVSAQSLGDWAGTAFGARVSAPTAGGPISIEDLVRLRDLSGLSPSPDGRLIAFAVYQAVPETNSYVMKWFVVPADGSSLPRPLDVDGGQPISTDIHGLPYAYVLPAYAQWSPDGKSVAIRSLRAGHISLWVVDVVTGHSAQASAGNADVVAFGWSESGALLYRTGVDREKFERTVTEEGRRGWLFDGRIQFYSAHMRPPPPNCERTPKAIGCENLLFAYERERGVRPADDHEQAIFATLAMPGEANISPQFRADGASVSAPAIDKRYEKATLPIRRVATDMKGAKRCGVAACEGMYLRALGWARNGRSAWFLKSESSLARIDGVPRDRTGLYEWFPETGRVKPVYRRASVLSDCHILDHAAICVEETAIIPPRVVAIDFDTKRVRVLADPNPMFATKVFPRVREIILTDKDGNKGFAQIVYPNNFMEGKSYPLVVTQYEARGFLRGQVGNEYPIFPMAAEGLMVMSVEWSRFTKLEQTSGYDAWNQFYADRGRDLIKSSIDDGIDQLIKEGIVDPTRLAITGLSGGAENVHYTLQRTNRYAAAIASSGSEDITFFAQASLDGDRARVMKNFGTTSVIAPPGNRVYDLAWSNKPEKLTTPLLVNVGEYEALVGFEGAAAIQNTGGPLEIRIFPDEQHLKYHPENILGVYKNNLDWLSFWLLGKESPAPELRAQFDRWRKMRASIKLK